MSDHAACALAAAWLRVLAWCSERSRAFSLGLLLLAAFVAAVALAG